MRIPEDKIEEVRSAADIVDVIGGFVRLKKSGRGFTGLCPFHQEKTPSFHVHAEKNLYKCFGCGKGGNVFTFLMEMERVSFVEAVTTLAERYSVSLPTTTPEDKDTAEKRGALYEVNRFAARFFYDNLQSDSGTECQAYLRKRGWKEGTQRRFGIGYSAHSWDALLTRATSAGFTKEILEEAGLIIRKDDGKTYDRFRNRVMFPIFSPGGKAVGFGARALAKDDQPKYLNSPETAVYNKSRLLYGISFAVPAIRELDAVVLVEGYADVIALSQAGFTHVVATSGTALTRHQIQLLIRYTRNVLFLYDSDSAGANAMLRSIDTFLDEGIIPGIVLLPEGEDPDSYIQKDGPEALGKALAAPQSFVEFITARYKDEGKLDSPEGKTEAVRHIVSLLVKIDDRIKQEFYLHHIADRFDIYENLLYAELSAQTQGKARKRPERERIVELDDPDEVDVVVAPLPRIEREFMTVLLNTSKDIISETLNAIHITDFTHDGVQHILLALLEQKEDHGAINIDELGNSFRDDIALQQLMAEFLVGRHEISKRWQDIQTVAEEDTRQVLLDTYSQILLNQIAERIRMVEQRLNRAKGNEELERELIRETLALQHMKQEALNARTFSDLPSVDL